MRDIEFDGRNGKTAGMQVIEENAAALKITLLGMTQENLRLAIPGIKPATAANGEIKNPKMGVISEDCYCKNITMFAQTLDGAYKKIVIFNPMTEGEMTLSTQHKAEGELEIEFTAHYPKSDTDGDLWSVTDAAAIEESEAGAP